MDIIITSPSLDTRKNVSGISSVTRFIINNNKKHKYIHFELGRADSEGRGIKRLFSLLNCFIRWRTLIRNNSNAIIHYNFPLTTKGILRDSVFIYVVRNRKVLLHIHGGNYVTEDNTPWIIDKILHSIFKYEHPVITLSDYEKKKIKEKYSIRNVISLPNCIDLDDAIAFKRTANYGVLNIGYIGRLDKDKGLNELLEACKVLLDNKVPFVCHFAGKEVNDDEFIPRYKETLGNSFKYHGVLFGAQKTEFFKLLDIFVMPSYYEGLPISLLESMSFSIAPIVTPVGSIPKVVTDKDNGMFIKKKNVDTIVESILKLNKDRDKLFQIGNKAKETIVNNFNPHDYIKKLNMLYAAFD